MQFHASIIIQAQLAMDQLHRIASAERKQFFLLSHLEPEVESHTSDGIKTPVHQIVAGRAHFEM